MVIFVVALVNVLDQGISVTDITTVEMDQMKLTAVSNCICTYSKPVTNSMLNSYNTRATHNY